MNPSLLSPQKGRLLISKPAILNDPSFNRSVILLTEHDHEGSVGFIINKPSEYMVSDLVPEVDCNFTVYEGGPVGQDSLYFAHRRPELIENSIEIGNGIYWGGDFNSLRGLLDKQKIKKEDIRFFLGYSGWETEQLKEELKVDSWVVVENKYDNIFKVDETSFWKNKLLEMGGKYKIWANAPSDSNLN